MYKRLLKQIFSGSGGCFSFKFPMVMKNLNNDVGLFVNIVNLIASHLG